MKNRQKIKKFLFLSEKEKKKLKNNKSYKLAKIIYWVIAFIFSFISIYNITRQGWFGIDIAERASTIAFFAMPIFLTIFLVFYILLCFFFRKLFIEKLSKNKKKQIVGTLMAIAIAIVILMLVAVN